MGEAPATVFLADSFVGRWVVIATSLFGILPARIGNLGVGSSFLNFYPYPPNMIEISLKTFIDDCNRAMTETANDLLSFTILRILQLIN